MADRVPYRDTATDPGTPRWVKALGIAAILVILLVVLVMLIGGGEHGPGRHAASRDAGGQTPPATAPVTARGVGGPAEPSEAARAIDVTALDTLAFEPTSVEVSAGEVVTFEVTDRGQTVHDFTLGDVGMQAEHSQAMGHMPGGMAHALPNSITVQPGETRELTWRFRDAGKLEYACHELGHYDSGMRGPITVS